MSGWAPGRRSGSIAVDRRATARLVLRRPTPEDTPWVAGLHADPANYVHAPDGAHSPVDARALADRGLADWERHGIGYWLVEHDGEPVGMAGVTPMRFRDRECFNLYFRFVSAARGRGFAAEACREALVVAAARAPQRPVVVRTRPGNAPALGLAAALGLQRRAELEGDDGFVVLTSAW